MGRSKQAGKRVRPGQKTATSEAPVVPTKTVGELLIDAARFISTCDYLPAKEASLNAVKVAELGQSAEEKTDAYEVLGTVELELGEVEDAREHFLAAIKHASTIADPSPAPHLYMAQLSSPAESLQYFTSALAILQAKLVAIEAAKTAPKADGEDAAMDEDEVEEAAEEEAELRRSASKALVGMTELYLTDLCFEDDAEANCEKHLALAASIDPSDPEVYHTLASVRISQERNDDALEAARKGWSLWKDLEPDSEYYPEPETRLNLARVLVELSQLQESLEILHGLELEDDEDLDVLYLTGWAWWLLAEARSAKPAVEGEEESAAECLSEAKLAFESYTKFEARDPEAPLDPEQSGHVKELLAKLNEAGVVAKAAGAREGDEEWEDESDDEEAMETA